MFNVQNLLTELLADYKADLAKESKNEPIQVEIELAGVKKNEITVTSKGGALVVRVDSERRKGVRTIYTNDCHDIDKAGITYIDGLLKINIPLKEDMARVEKLLTIA